MRITIIIGIFLSNFLFAVSAFSAPRSVDVATFDVAGVKTGMGYQEAVAAAAKHFKVSKNAIKADPWPSVNEVTKTKLPSYFTYENNGVKLQVSFVARVPVNKNNPLVVSRITYEIPWSKANYEAMMKAALSKYGTQTNAPHSTPMVWCKNPSRNPGDACDLGKAHLKLVPTTLELIDPAWRKAASQYLDDQKKRSLNF